MAGLSQGSAIADLDSLGQENRADGHSLKYRDNTDLTLKSCLDETAVNSKQVQQFRKTAIDRVCLLFLPA